MKKAISIWSFADKSIEDSILLAAKAGFELKKDHIGRAQRLHHHLRPGRPEAPPRRALGGVREAR